MKPTLTHFILILALISLHACTIHPKPEPISFGKDQCAFCKMTISNPNFGAELITDKGRILKYDATECLVNHLNSDAPPHQALYAVPYDRPKTLQAVEELQYLISPDFRSPMGANLAAFSTPASLNPQYHPQLINWSTLLESL